MLHSLKNIQPALESESLFLGPFKVRLYLYAMYLHSTYRTTNKHQGWGKISFRISSDDGKGAEQPIPCSTCPAKPSRAAEVAEATTSRQLCRRLPAARTALTSWAERKWMCNSFLSLSTKGRKVTVTSSSVLRLAPAPRLPYPSFSMATRAEKWPLV